jgi:hypothetical protein
MTDEAKKLLVTSIRSFNKEVEIQELNDGRL